MKGNKPNCLYVISELHDCSYDSTCLLLRLFLAHFAGATSQFPGTVMSPGAAAFAARWPNLKQSM